MSKKKVLFTILRIAITVGLLVWVFSKIEFYDSVKIKDSQIEYRGTVVNRDALLDGTADAIVMRDRDGGERRIPLAEVDVGQVEEHDFYTRGFFSIVSTIDVWLFVLGVLLYGVINFTGVFRFQILMRVQRINLSFRRSTKLTFLGLFYNNVMPGMAGGDAIKAYYAARDTEHKTGAVVGVFFDRLVGLLGLAILAAATILTRLGDARFYGVARGVAIFIGVMAVGAIFIFSRRLRRFIRLKKIMSLIPFASVRRILKEIDNAIFIYRLHKRAVVAALAISVFGHSFMITACYFWGRAMGIDVLTPGDCFVFLPAVFMIMSLPISMAGWGLAENAFGWLLKSVGVALGESATMGVLFNLTRTLWSLPGALVLLAMGRRASADEIEREMEALDAEMRDMADDDG